MTKSDAEMLIKLEHFISESLPADEVATHIAEEARDVLLAQPGKPYVSGGLYIEDFFNALLAEGDIYYHNVYELLDLDNINATRQELSRRNIQKLVDEIATKIGYFD